jgi:uncharacterized protein YjiS (DUF1127 family)
VHILSEIRSQLGRFASTFAARHKASTEISQLYRFDDRDLRDVGLSRSDFPRLIRGTYRRD